MLELDEGQLSRPVLRGRGGSNTSLLPGYEKQARASPPPQGGARVYGLLPWVPDRGWPLLLSKPIGGQNRGQMLQKGGEFEQHAT